MRYYKLIILTIILVFVSSCASFLDKKEKKTLSSVEKNILISDGYDVSDKLYAAKHYQLNGNYNLALGVLTEGLNAGDVESYILAAEINRDMGDTFTGLSLIDKIYTANRNNKRVVDLRNNLIVANKANKITRLEKQVKELCKKYPQDKSCKTQP